MKINPGSNSAPWLCWFVATLFTLDFFFHGANRAEKRAAAAAELFQGVAADQGTSPSSHPTLGCSGGAVALGTEVQAHAGATGLQPSRAGQDAASSGMPHFTQVLEPGSTTAPRAFFRLFRSLQHT